MRASRLLPLLAIVAFPALSRADLVTLSNFAPSSLTASAIDSAVSNTDSIAAIPFDNSAAPTHAVGRWQASTSAVLTDHSFSFTLSEDDNHSTGSGSASSGAILYFTPAVPITYTLRGTFHVAGDSYFAVSAITFKNESTPATLYSNFFDVSSNPNATFTLPTTVGTLDPGVVYSLNLSQALRFDDPTATSTYTLDFAPITTPVPLPSSAASFLILLPLLAIAKLRRPAAAE